MTQQTKYYLCYQYELDLTWINDCEISLKSSYESSLTFPYSASTTWKVLTVLFPGVNQTVFFKHELQYDELRQFEK